MKILKEGIKEYARMFECECEICDTKVEITWGDPSILGFSRCVDSKLEEYKYRIKWACPICECENLDEYRSGNVKMLKYSQRRERKAYIEEWYRKTHYSPDYVEQKEMPDGIDVSWYNEDGTKKPTNEEIRKYCMI